MSADSQTRLVGQPDGVRAEIETSGRVIRPFFDAVAAVVDECKLRVDESGISINAVDPSNVAAMEIEAPAEAFESYDVIGGDETVIGLDLDALDDHLSHARLGKRNDDPVELTLDAATLVAEIERDYGETTTRRRDEWLPIDPDAVRQEPEVPTLSLPWHADVDRRGLVETIESMPSNHFDISEADGSMAFEAKAYDGNGDNDPVEATRVTFEGVVEATEEQDDADYDDASSIISLSYAREVAKGLTAAKVDRVGVTFGEEFPIFFDFERTDGDGQLVYEGRYMVAPRIGSSDSP